MAVERDVFARACRGLGEPTAAAVWSERGGWVESDGPWRIVARAVVPGELMYRRDPEGVELAAIGAVVQLDGQRVVDVGCGTGRLTRLAARSAAWVYAFDPDPDSVEQARASLSAELGRRVSFGVHSAEALDVPRRRFDTALCGWSL